MRCQAGKSRLIGSLKNRPTLCVTELVRRCLALDKLASVSVGMQPALHGPQA